MHLTEEELKQYKRHPRVLEVRLCILFHLFEKEYGYQSAMKFVDSICNAYRCNVTLLNAIINRRFEIIRNVKIKQQLWRQEAIFMGCVYGITPYKVAKYYLNIKPNVFYSQTSLYSIENFCTNEWLDKLDQRTMLCGQEMFRIEVIRFLEVLDSLADVLNIWKGVG